MLYHNINNYMKRYNIYLALKTIQYKSYNNLQSLLVSIHYSKDLLINFITDLPISIN